MLPSKGDHTGDLKGGGRVEDWRRKKGRCSGMPQVLFTAAGAFFPVIVTCSWCIGGLPSPH